MISCSAGPGTGRDDAMEEMKSYIKANQAAWDRWARVHEKSSFYDLDGFRETRSSLNDVEIEELGPVDGKSLLHLQCHIGVDTLSWAGRGARATGVDISEQAVRIARSLGRELDIPARFLCCDVHDLRLHLAETFEVVFTSYGVLWWMPDLGAWARLIYDYLDTGGLFYMVEFHPLVYMLNEDGALEHTYFGAAEPWEETESGTYADRRADVQATTYGWQHGLGEAVTALVAAGLEIESLVEHPYVPFDCFAFTSEVEPGRYGVRGLEGKVPLLFSVRAKKK